MRRPSCASLVALSCLYSFMATTVAAPQPSASPAVQRTITISYRGAADKMPWGTPSPGYTDLFTLDLNCKEVLHVTGGMYDKTTGLMDLVRLDPVYE